MKESLNFYFGYYPDSTKGYLLSSDLGIINASLDNDLFEEYFIPERELKEIEVRGNNKPYFNEINNKPLEFTLSFAFEDSFNSNNIDGKHKKLRELAKWLIKPYYIPFGVVNDDRIFYVTAINKSQLFHNGIDEGYITIDFRCDAPWAYSKFKQQILNGLAGEGDSFEFINNGDLEIFPELWVKKIVTGEFKIVNESTGQIFLFNEILDGEQIYIHNEKEYIESSRPNIYRYSGFNNNYLKIIPGVNRLIFYGSADVIFRYQEKLITI